MPHAQPPNPDDSDRPDNLRTPADHDHGPYGIFDDQAGGFLDPFLKTLPATAKTFAAGATNALKDRTRRWHR